MPSRVKKGKKGKKMGHSLGNGPQTDLDPTEDEMNEIYTLSPLELREQAKKRLACIYEISKQTDDHEGARKAAKLQLLLDLLVATRDDGAWPYFKAKLEEKRRRDAEFEAEAAAAADVSATAPDGGLEKPTQTGDGMAKD